MTSTPNNGGCFEILLIGSPVGFALTALAAWFVQPFVELNDPTSIAIWVMFLAGTLVITSCLGVVALVVALAMIGVRW